MKKYTLHQLKTEKIAIHTPTQEIYDALMKKFEAHNIIWTEGNKATAVAFKAIYNYIACPDSEGGRLVRFSDVYRREAGYTIIIPDQIDWGEGKEEGKKDMIYPIICGSELNKTPTIFANAQKDWNAFKSFAKEIEAYGRTLTSAQLKAYMAKERKLRGGKWCDKK